MRQELSEEDLEQATGGLPKKVHKKIIANPIYHKISYLIEDSFE